MPIIDEGELDVERLLEELESKRRFLNLVIAALAREAEAGEEALATAVRSLRRDDQGPVSDLPSESQSFLLHLATQMRRGANGTREEQHKLSRQVA